ncbi:TlpA disulfide reductase family protein [Geojedonia litorea]|uniref:TlpA disulfide reductase family protein n=1 Tax=Geojedonia litorea TaxID=1268269 RepID=A0ABV9MZV7_9FLAO
MKHLYLLVIVLILSCQDKKSDKKNIAINDEPVATTELEIYDYSGLEQFLTRKDEKTYVVNFWATWCAPCVKEMPYFEKLNADYNSKGVEVILVSLDFPKQYDSKLKPFIKNKNLQSKVVVLDDPDANSWIPKISEDWSGSIPATLIYNKEKRQFYEQSFNFDELETEVKQFLK